MYAHKYTDVYTQSRLRTFCKKLSCYALSVPRRELKSLGGLLTGHITLNCYEDPSRSIVLSMWRTRRDFTPLLGGMLC